MEPHSFFEKNCRKRKPQIYFLSMMQNCLLLQKKPALLSTIYWLFPSGNQPELCATLVRAWTAFLASTFGKNGRKWAKYPLHILISDVGCGPGVEHRPGHGKEDDFLWQAAKGKVWAMLSCLHLSSLSHIILSIPKKWQEIFSSSRTNTHSWKTSQISYVIAILYWQTFPATDI